VSADASAVWQALGAVMDPEIPVVSLVELGVIRQVEVDGRRARIVMTPTFSGCPALDVMCQQVEHAVSALGFDKVEVALSFDPPWTTDGLSAETRARLRDFGLAPPPWHGGNVRFVLDQPAACPYCGSLDTRLTNAFGSTQCRSIHVCNACRGPFEAFKPM
jgi:ring-1,2-phenylacetyl-CoA epoxidase subunit PaaD